MLLELLLLKRVEALRRGEAIVEEVLRGDVSHGRGWTHRSVRGGGGTRSPSSSS